MSNTMTDSITEMASGQTNDSQTWLEKLPGVMRAFGGIAVLLSLYSFMLNGWEGSSDLVRYSMLLGHTGLLAVIALLSGHFFKEGKGPRLLLMLALVSVSANFSILGAFIFSATTDVGGWQYPQYLSWTVDGISTALITTTVACVILIPVIAVGFRTLARGLSVKLGVMFALSNLVLLLPMRDPWLLTVVVISLSVYTLLASAKTARQRTEANTLEGRVALLLQFLPIGILIGRNVWLYAADSFVYMAAALSIFVALRQCLLLMPSNNRFKTLVEFISAWAALCAGGGLITGLAGAGMSEALAIVAGSLLSGAMIYELSMRASAQRLYRFLATALVVISLLFNIVVGVGMLASMMALVGGVIMLVASFSLQQRALFIGGLILLVTSIGYQLLKAFQFYDFGYWATLAVLGVLAIVLGSVLESRGARIRQGLLNYKARYAQWNY